MNIIEYTEKESDDEKWLREFDEWMEELDPQTPVLTDECMSRENIYNEQIQRQR